MKPFVVVILLCALVFAAWGERSAGPCDPVRGVGALAPGSPQAQRDAWFLRAIELSLAGGSVPLADRFFDGGEVRSSPWAPLFPALTAGLLRNTAFSELEPLERGALPARRLESLLEFGLPLLGALACVAVFLAARSLHGGPTRNVAGLIAAAAYAFAPSVIFAERIGRVDSFALETLLGCGLLAAGNLALRAREDIDATLGGLLAGVLAGLNAACGPGTLPVLGALGASLAAAAWRARPGARRALVLCALSAALTAGMALGSLGRWSDLWPPLQARSVHASADVLGAWLPLAVLPIGLLLLVLPRPLPERALPAVFGVLALVWALAVDPLAGNVALAACLCLGVGAADRARGARLALLCVLLLAPSLGWRRSAEFHPPEVELVRRAAWSAGLDWMRLATPSSGPWNHPGAQPDGFVLTDPESALEVAVRARRAVAAAEPAGVRSPPQTHARSARARAWLDRPPTDGLLDELLAARVRHVVVGACGRARARGGLADVLLRAAPDAAPMGFERLWVSEARVEGLPVLSIWICRAERGPREVPLLRAR